VTGAVAGGEWLDHVIDCANCWQIIRLLVSFYRFFPPRTPPRCSSYLFQFVAVLISSGT